MSEENTLLLKTNSHVAAYRELCFRNLNQTIQVGCEVIAANDGLRVFKFLVTARMR